MNESISEILQNGKAKNATEKEKQELLALFHKPDKEFLLKDYLFQLLKSESESYVSQTSLTNLFNRLWAKIQQNHQPYYYSKRLFNHFVKFAAVLAIGLVLGIYISTVTEESSEPVFYAAHSPKGSVSDVKLPDGTVIFLNADSHIEYSMDGLNGNREVYLEGEAWFDVAKNPKKPFVVKTAFYTVQVTGTKFNVKAYNTDNEIITTLEEGSVIVGSSDNVRLAQEISLKPGEQLIFNKKTKAASVKTVNTGWFTSWKDNKLIFINMEFKELVVLLERKYGVEIEVKNKEILDRHFDGTIKNESIIEILDIIKKALPIQYKIIGQQIEISNKND